jgi:hypothetical protein
MTLIVEAPKAVNGQLEISTPVVPNKNDSSVVHLTDKEVGAAVYMAEHWGLQDKLTYSIGIDTQGRPVEAHELYRNRGEENEELIATVIPTAYRNDEIVRVSSPEAARFVLSELLPQAESNMVAAQKRAAQEAVFREGLIAGSLGDHGFKNPVENRTYSLNSYEPIAPPAFVGKMYEYRQDVLRSVRIKARPNDILPKPVLTRAA